MRYTYLHKLYLKRHLTIIESYKIVLKENYIQYFLIPLSVLFRFNFFIQLIPLPSSSNNSKILISFSLMMLNGLYYLFLSFSMLHLASVFRGIIFTFEPVTSINPSFATFIKFPASRYQS